jgi:hypothetical protein
MYGSVGLGSPKLWSRRKSARVMDGSGTGAHMAILTMALSPSDMSSQAVLKDNPM